MRLHDDLGISKLNRLRSQGDRSQTRTAHHVNGQGPTLRAAGLLSTLPAEPEPVQFPPVQRSP